MIIHHESICFQSFLLSTPPFFEVKNTIELHPIFFNLAQSLALTVLYSSGLQSGSHFVLTANIFLFIAIQVFTTSSTINPSQRQQIFSTRPKHLASLSDSQTRSKRPPYPGQSKIVMFPIFATIQRYYVQGILEVFNLVLKSVFRSEDLPTLLRPTKITDFPGYSSNFCFFKQSQWDSLIC